MCGGNHVTCWAKLAGLEVAYTPTFPNNGTLNFTDCRRSRLRFVSGTGSSCLSAGNELSGTHFGNHDAFRWPAEIAVKTPASALGTSEFRSHSIAAFDDSTPEGKRLEQSLWRANESILNFNYGSLVWAPSRRRYELSITDAVLNTPAVNMFGYISTVPGSAGETQMVVTVSDGGTEVVVAKWNRFDDEWNNDGETTQWTPYIGFSGPGEPEGPLSSMIDILPGEWFWYPTAAELVVAEDMKGPYLNGVADPRLATWITSGTYAVEAVISSGYEGKVYCPFLSWQKTFYESPVDGSLFYVSASGMTYAGFHPTYGVRYFFGNFKDASNVRSVQTTRTSTLATDGQAMAGTYPAGVYLFKQDSYSPPDLGAAWITNATTWGY